MGRSQGVAAEPATSRRTTRKKDAWAAGVRFAATRRTRAAVVERESAGQRQEAAGRPSARRRPIVGGSTRRIWRNRRRLAASQPPSSLLLVPRLLRTGRRTVSRQGRGRATRGRAARRRGRCLQLLRASISISAVVRDSLVTEGRVHVTPRRTPTHRGRRKQGASSCRRALRALARFITAPRSWTGSMYAVRTDCDEELAASTARESRSTPNGTPASSGFMAVGARGLRRL